MSYQALYRVWRPRQFADIVGQEPITRTLQNAMADEKLSHAYLFTGPRGTGKTSAAKIIARTVNCEKAPTSEPCNECPTCLGISDGSISDVIEIDAASNNGVDEIRDIRDKVKYVPSHASYKVYIIDEVHMLSTGAFNALLKTLEEPPKHVIFILATTEPHKLPLTIISRCQRFDFRRISNQAIVSRMKEIVEKEHIPCDVEALQIIARAAEGGMRDALSILDQAVSYSDERLTAEAVLAVTGTVSKVFLARTVSALHRQKTEEALATVHELMEAGKDPLRFLEDLLYYLRDLLLFQTAPTLEEVARRTENDEHFRELAEKSTKEWIYAVIDIVNDSLREMKWTNHPQIFLEVAFVKICQVEPEAQNSALMNKIEHLEKRLNALTKQNTVAEQQPLAGLPQEQTRPRATPSKQVQTMLKKASKQQLTHLKQVWGEVMEKIRQEKISAHAWLKVSQPVACSNEAFLLSFQHDLHCQMAGKDQIRQTVEAAVANVVGKPLAMLTILETDWQEVKKSFVRKRQAETKTPVAKSEEDPLIAEAKKLFGEDMVEIIEKGE